MDKKKTKQRIYDIAKEYNISSDALLKVLRGLGFTIKSHMSVASEDMLEAIEDKFKKEIEATKKDDEARKKRLQEIEAKKRREEAEKAARRRKAEKIARKKKALAEEKAKERAARELERLKKEKPEKPIEAAKPEPAKPAPPKEKPAVTAKEKTVEKPARKPEPKRVAPPVEREKPATPRPQARAEAPPKPKKERPARPSRRKETGVKAGVTVSPEAAKQIQKKLQQSVATTKAERKRKKRDRGKKSRGAHKVDKAAVQISFKQTMANIEGGKKVKKYKRRPQDADAVGEEIQFIEVTAFLTVSELANLFDKKPAEVIAKLMEMGMMASINQRLDMDTIETLALEFGVNVKPVEEPAELIAEVEEEVNLQPRPPVVTIMGHVDHGKTTLLDYIRKSKIVSGEAGEITQHIGAYSVRTPGGDITFLDTPGHEAFSAMRARGAQVTDIVILVVSAAESVMPQTLEAIDHARAAGVPIIVAINKMDLPAANPDAVRQQLASHNLLDEAWGGKTIMVEISAKKGTGVDKLMEMILLQSEMMELKADPDIKAHGTVIEARLEKGRGTVTTVLVQRGTLHVGDPFVAGSYYGRVRAMINDRGGELTEAGPSAPAQVMGISGGVPLAGETIIVTADESDAREISLKRQQIKREHELRRVDTPTTLESVYAKIKDGQITDLKIIVKGDVAGSVEALTETLGSIGNEEVRVNIIRSGVGAITESDVLLAAASDAIVVGFHVTAETRAREMANREKVDIRTYSIIYEVKEDITKAIEGLLKPEMVEKWMGTAEVRQTFRVPKAGTISGSYIQSGRIHRGDLIRVSRDGVVIHEGRISSLKRFKDDVREVTTGLECGIGLEKFEDVKAGDLIEAYDVVATERKLHSDSR